MTRRILIFGYGSIAKRHVRLLKEFNSGYQIGVYKPNLFQPNSLVDYTFNSFQECLRYNPDIAIIASPANFHIEQAVLMANNGTHLLIEKPLSNELEGVSNLSKIIYERQINCHIGYNLRYSESLIFFKKLVENNFAGKPLYLNTEVGQYLPLWRPEIDYKKSVSSQKKYGGGVLLELSHEIDYLTWIFGNISCVSAFVSKLSHLDLDVEDYCDVRFSIENHQSNKEIAGSLRLDFIRQDIKRTCTLVCSEGTITWNGVDNTVSYSAKDKYQNKILFRGDTDINSTYKLQWKSFIESIMNNKPVDTSINDGITVLRVIDAIIISSNNNFMKEKVKYSKN